MKQMTPLIMPYRVLFNETQSSLKIASNFLLSFSQHLYIVGYNCIILLYQDPKSAEILQGNVHNALLHE